MWNKVSINKQNHLPVHIHILYNTLHRMVVPSQHTMLSPTHVAIFQIGILKFQIK